MKSSREQHIGLIAGSGQFPLLFVEGAREAGYHVTVVGFDAETDPALEQVADDFHWLKLGQLNKLIQTFKRAGVTRVAMAGAITKTKLYAKIRPDWRAFKLLHQLRSKKDDMLLRTVAQELENEGIRIEPSTLFLPGLLAPEGIFTRRRPTGGEWRDIEFGWEMAKAVGRLDIGQCVVVKHQAVLAVEGIDGTDATIERGGTLCGKGAVVVKVSKPTQDLRFDVPAIGIRTIATMRSVKARVLVIEAGKTLFFDRQQVIKQADEAGITIVAKASPEESPPAEQPVAADKGSAPGPQRERRPVLVSCETRPDAVRTAVIGVGYLGRYHAQKYARLPDADLVAVVDINEEQGRRVAREVGCAHYRNFRDIIHRVDACSVVTPTPTHYTITRELLEAGKHVLVEKPMTDSVATAEKLGELAASARLVLQIGHLERFNPAFRSIRPQFVDPLFIEAHRLAPFNERGTDVDVIFDLMIHDIDIVLDTIPSPLVGIHSSGVPVLTQLPDIANARLDFANGATANLTASRISVKSMRRLRVFQENCYLVADYGSKRAFVFRREGELDEAGYPEISVEELDVEDRDALEDEIASFLRSVKNHLSPEVDARQAAGALRVAQEISRQIREKIARQ